MTTFVLIFFAIQLVLSTSVAEDLTVKLPDGDVQGKILNTSNHKMYYGFQGIPYATPPLGNLRFEAPQPPRPWNGTRDATKERSVCLSSMGPPPTSDFQVKFQSTEPSPEPGPELPESEDCLYINVYTPALKPTKKLPVMFWIYGGGFVGGSSSFNSFNPDFLIEEDIVFVSFNYRLNSFGFLSTGDSAILGNAGLKDQNLALKWTKKNIALFGGDPDKITIFGQSAGGFSISSHVLSKKSAGLFRAAIVESGSAVDPWLDENPKSYAFLLADALNGSQYKNDTTKLKKFLQTVTAEQILNATRSVKVEARPVMEVEDDDAFLSQPPYQLFESGNFNQVPIMTGITPLEKGMALQSLEQAKQMGLSLDSHPEQLIPKDLKQNSSDTDAVIKEIQNIYLKNGETFSSNLIALAEFSSDADITRGVIKLTDLTSKYVPVYLYQFAYYGRVSMKPVVEGAEKATHGAELFFLFNRTSDTTNLEDLRIQNITVKLWTNFAKYLNPTPEPSATVNITWPTVSPGNLHYLNINNTLSVLPSLKQYSYPKWINVYETYGRKPFITF